MKRWMKLSLAVASLCVRAPAIAQTTGIDANSVNTWLASNGYANKLSDADLAAHRAKMLPYWSATSLPTTRQSDELLATHLAHVRATFANFDSYPVYIQDSLLDADFHDEFETTEFNATSKAIGDNDWAAAANAYHDRASFSEGESYFAAKDAFDALPDKNSPDAKALQVTISKYQDRQNDRIALEHMQTNELAFTRYGRELDVEHTWQRAALIGQAGFTFIPPAQGSPNADNRTLETVDILNFENRERFAAPGESAGFSHFIFSTPSSTFGLSDVSAKTNRPFIFQLFDRNIEDGDIETVTLVNGSGSHINQTITLINAGQTFTTRLTKGDNEIRVLAQNQGSLGVNTGGLRITSPVLSGPTDQNVGLNTGQTGVLRITGR